MEPYEHSVHEASRRSEISYYFEILSCLMEEKKTNWLEFSVWQGWCSLDPLMWTMQNQPSL